MLRSNPNVKYRCCLGACLNKLELENNSKYDVKYEATIYKASQITHIENGAAVNAGGVEVCGNNKIDYSHAESLKTEIGVIPQNGTNYVTVDGSKKVRIRYYYIGFHDDYTDEERNFTVYDKVWFDQPSAEMIKQIEDANNTCMPCATTFKKNCDDGNTVRCPRCKHFYCSWHINVNKGLNVGGHVCY